MCVDEMVHDHEMVGLSTDREESTAHNSGAPYLTKGWYNGKGTWQV